MPAVLVHGVPSTATMWNPLRAHLARRDVVALSLPGFGCPVPAGFACTKEAYVDWLAGEVERLGPGLDLVGHDWGALLALRVASVRPALVRTWAVGDASVDHTYTWHPLAQAWQTPGRGEEVMARMIPDRVAETLAREGVPRSIARVEAAEVDATMKACILTLYRSAVTVPKTWEDELERLPARGLVFWGEDDPYVGVEYGERLALRRGVRLLRLPATGHWLPQQRPAELASALEDLWR
jgi:pimeloyl-ACP methyl ester carboxylesterase